MQTVFWTCFGVGAAVLALQILLGLLGMDHDVAHDFQDVSHDAEHGAGDGEQGLNLLSVRALSAAVAMFGAAGLGLLAAGVAAFLAASIAVVPAFLAALGTAWITRQMLRLESDGSLHVENAVGTSGTAYLSIPAVHDGYGMIQFPLQGRTVELRAVTSDAQPIPAGASVVVVGIVDGDTVEVTLTPEIEGI